jgi:hypothetical protein
MVRACQLRAGCATSHGREHVLRASSNACFREIDPPQHSSRHKTHALHRPPTICGRAQTSAPGNERGLPVLVRLARGSHRRGVRPWRFGAKIDWCEREGADAGGFVRPWPMVRSCRDSCDGCACLWAIQLCVCGISMAGHGRWHARPLLFARMLGRSAPFVQSQGVFLHSIAGTARCGTCHTGGTNTSTGFGMAVWECDGTLKSFTSVR